MARRLARASVHVEVCERCIGDADRTCGGLGEGKQEAQARALARADGTGEGERDRTSRPTTRRSSASVVVALIAKRDVAELHGVGQARRRSVFPKRRSTRLPRTSETTRTQRAGEHVRSALGPDLRRRARRSPGPLYPPG